MFEEHGLGYYGAEAAASCKTGGGREEMDEKDHEIAYFRILQQSKTRGIPGKLAIRQGHHKSYAEMPSACAEAQSGQTPDL